MKKDILRKSVLYDSNYGNDILEKQDYGEYKKMISDCQWAEDGSMEGRDE